MVKKIDLLHLMHTKRKAIAMIELIFAIVIMGIVMLSTPMLIDRSTKSTYVALQQESIAAAAAQINMIMTAEWDDADTNQSIGAPILQTGSGVIANCTTRKPIGVTSSSGRYCRDALATDTLFLPAIPVASLGTDGSESFVYDDVDDYNNQSYEVSVYNSESYATHQGDYLDRNITILSNVYYGDDLPRLVSGGASAGGYDQNITFANPFRTIVTANSTNIKLITVKLTSSNPADEIKDKQIILSAFMCNIGAPTPDIYNNRP